jgi:hypothetical protein
MRRLMAFVPPETVLKMFALIEMKKINAVYPAKKSEDQKKRKSPLEKGTFPDWLVQPNRLHIIGEDRRIRQEKRNAIRKMVEYSVLLCGGGRGNGT